MRSTPLYFLSQCHTLECYLQRSVHFVVYLSIYADFNIVLNRTLYFLLYVQCPLVELYILCNHCNVYRTMSLIGPQLQWDYRAGNSGSLRPYFSLLSPATDWLCVTRHTSQWWWWWRWWWWRVIRIVITDSRKFLFYCNMTALVCAGFAFWRSILYENHINLVPKLHFVHNIT